MTCPKHEPARVEFDGEACPICEHSGDQDQLDSIACSLGEVMIGLYRVARDHGALNIGLPQGLQGNAEAHALGQTLTANLCMVEAIFKKRYGQKNILVAQQMPAGTVRQ